MANGCAFCQNYFLLSSSYVYRVREKKENREKFHDEIEADDGKRQLNEASSSMNASANMKMKINERTLTCILIYLFFFWHEGQRGSERVNLLLVSCHKSTQKICDFIRNVFQRHSNGNNGGAYILFF